MPRFFTSLLIVAISVCFGCGEGRESSFSHVGSSLEDKPGGEVKAKGIPPAQNPGPAGNANQPGQPPKAEEVARKIVYTATIDLVVEDLDNSVSEMTRLLKVHEGYVAQSETRGSPGAQCSGSWTLRVPVGQFESFTEALSKIGELRRNKLDSKDITDAYFDLKAHITNDEVREKGLQKLYVEKAAGSKLEDLLAVDRELSSVRARIETQKGQLQRWDKETTLATIHVNLFDRREYVPPTDPEFSTVIGRTFQNSVKNLTTFGKQLVLFGVAITPWLPVIAIFVGLVWLLFRRRHRAIQVANPPAS